MKNNEFYVQYIEEFSRLILCSIFPNYFLYHNVSNKSPDLIDVRNKLGFEVTLGIIPNVALKYLKANSPTYFLK